MSHLEYGSVVWVRLGQAWWPGTITTLEKCPPEFVEGLRKTPVAVVKFFNENEFQDVNKEEHIFPYSCDRKEEFIRRGQCINKNQSHGEVDLLRKFESDIVTAEKLTGGDMNILQTMGEVMDAPTNSRLYQLDLSSDPHSTQVERPQGCLPGEIVFGEPEGPTPFESGKMRSPHSNNTQLVDVGKQESSDDSDCYIEEEFDRAPHTLPKGMENLGSLPPGAHSTDSHKQGQSHSQYSGVRSHIVTVDEQTGYSRSDRYEEIVQTSGTGMLHNMRHNVVQYGPPRNLGHGHKESDFEERHLTNVPTDNRHQPHESRNVIGYPAEAVQQSPEVVEVDSEPQSPEIIEETSEVMEQVEESEVVMEEEEEPQPQYSEAEVSPNEYVPQSVVADEVVSQTPMLVEEQIEHEEEHIGGPDVIPESPGEVTKVTESEISIAPCETGTNHVNRSYESVEEAEIPVEESDDTKNINDKYIHKSNDNKDKCPRPLQDSLVLSNLIQDTKILPDEDNDERHSKSFTEDIPETEYVKENGGSFEEASPVQDKDDDYQESSKELPDQSDSEQMVTSSGMGDDIDDSRQLIDESCDSSACGNVELDTSQEAESDREVSLDDSCKSNADLSCTGDEVEEADSSLSDLEKSDSKVDTSMSENETHGSGRRARREAASTVKEKAVPKRKREPSQKRSKKLKVGEKHDCSEEQIETDTEELPDLLKTAAGTPRVDDKKLKVGDLVWVKYRKDWWPSYIKNAYPRDKKFSIVFVACDQNSGIRVNSRNVKKLDIYDVPGFVNKNQEGFSSALHLCKLFQQILDQGSEISSLDFFTLSPQAQVALLNQKKMPKSKSCSEPRRQKHRVSFVTDIPKSTPKKMLFDDPDYDSQMSSRERNKLQSALKARKADNQKLVKFMKSNQCTEYLWKIYKEEIQSERHNTFKDVDSRKGLLWTGIGPFQLDDGDDQIMSVIDFFKKEILSKDPQVSSVGDYVIQVWIPEAIREALRVVKKVPESELEEALSKGYRETAIEKRARKLSF